MAWQDVETDVGSKLGRCSYSVHLKHGGARVSVPQSIAIELGWGPNTKFKLQVGAGEQDGSLRLVADPAGKIGCKPPPKGQGLLIRLGRWPGLAPRDVDKVSVDHEAQRSGAGALVVTLPKHATVNTPMPRTSSPTIAPPQRPAGNGGRTVDVTHRFFDDPKKPQLAPTSGTRTGGR